MILNHLALTSAKQLFLGVDGGGTKTKLLLINENEEKILELIGEASNFYSLGENQAEKNLRELLSRVHQFLPEESPNIQSAFLGLAGIYSDSSIDCFQKRIERLDIAEQVYFDSDAYLGWFSATGGKPGISIISGTGSIAFGVNSEGVRQRIGGWGHTLGDEGSGYSIGLQGIQKAICAYEGRGQFTELIDHLFRFYKLENLEEILEKVSGQTELAQFAPEVHVAALNGDIVALGILEQAAESLAKHIFALYSQMDFGEDFVTVGIAGGCLLQMKLLQEKFRENIDKMGSQFQVQDPIFSAEESAAVLAKKMTLN